MGVGGKCHASATLPWERESVLIVGFRAVGGYEKSRPYRVSIPGPSSPLRVCVPTTLSRPTLLLLLLNVSEHLNESSW